MPDDNGKVLYGNVTKNITKNPADITDNYVHQNVNNTDILKYIDKNMYDKYSQVYVDKNNNIIVKDYLQQSQKADSAFTRNIKHYFRKKNNISNKTDKDAQLLFDLCLRTPANLRNTKDYVVAIKEDIELLKQKKIIFDNNNPTLIFNSKSSLANSLKKSGDLKSYIKFWLTGQKLDGKYFPETFSVTLSDTPNMLKAIHGAIIRNIKDNADGTVSFDLTDEYNFQYLPKNSGVDKETRRVNNYAYILQKLNIIKNYNIVVPITIKKSDL